MFIEESIWIHEALAEYPPAPGSEVLDIGSSNLEFRTNIQPHIAQNIHAPLHEKGCKLTFVDLKNDVGIDLVIDLSARDIPAGVFRKKYDLVLCCNILEHVADREVFMANLVKFVKPGSLILITVPNNYPKHEDPIDTMYRPGTAEVLTLLNAHVGVLPRKQTRLEIFDRRYYIWPKGRLLNRIFPWRANQSWRIPLKLFRWKVACVLVEVTHTNDAQLPDGKSKAEEV
jgi:SAM-dependent methyltransferase